MIRLQPSAYSRLLPLLDEPDFNVLFARSVLERRVSGAVHVDCVERPQAAYILHPYGLALLCGRPRSEGFVASLVDYMLDGGGKRSRLEQLQVHPAQWHRELQARLGQRLLDGTRTAHAPGAMAELGRGSVIELGRVNYRFDRSAFAALESPAMPQGLRVARASREVLAPWAGVVIPRYFWDSAEDFERMGVAFAVYDGERPLCVAFSAMWQNEGVEIGIEAHPEWRGRGLATLACAALIRFCLAEGVAPVWSTRHDNLGSQALAARLGFRETRRLPFYRLAMRGG